MQEKQQMKPENFLLLRKKGKTYFHTASIVIEFQHTCFCQGYNKSHSRGRLAQMENTRFIKCLCKGLGFNSEEVFEQKPFIMKSLLPMCDTTFFEKLKLQSCHLHTQSSSDWSHWSKRDM